MKVTVKAGNSDTFIGFIDHIRRRPGDVFRIADEPRRALAPGEQRMMERDPEAKAVYDRIKDESGKVPQAFSFRWMEPVDERVAEKVSTAQEALTKRQDELKSEKAAQRVADTGGSKADVI